MAMRIIGPAPFARGPDGKLLTQIGTIFPAQNVLVTFPPTHFEQRNKYVDLVDDERKQAGLPPLSPDERQALWWSAVDLILEADAIQIRPDPEHMELAFHADERLTAEYSRRRVQFLYVRVKAVFEAIRRRGAYWRITPLPTSAAEMRQLIEGSRIALGGRPIYYYNRYSGVRYLTYQEFVRLRTFPEDELRQHLQEIREHTAKTNRQGKPEVAFFMADPLFSSRDFDPYDFRTLAPAELRRAHQALQDKFRTTVPADFQQDNVQNIVWRNQMFTDLIDERETLISEDDLLGLNSEFYLQVEWLPGARFEQRELMLDPIFEPLAPGQTRDPLYDEKVPNFIFNFIREYGDLEYVNLGRIVQSLSRRGSSLGRREVYVAVLRPQGRHRDRVKILRMQKFDVAEALEAGKDRLQAMIDSDDYTDYILGRRVGCRQLGMNISPRLSAFKVLETYRGAKAAYRGYKIWSTYFERDYQPGVASDKIAAHRFQNDAYALRFAQLLGAAAAPNLVVGRCDHEKRVVFDEGDEVVREDNGLPEEIVVVEQMGSFRDYTNPLLPDAPAYAQPVLDRLAHVSRPREFAEAYIDAFEDRFDKIQQEYRLNRKAFDSLFAHRPRDPAGNLTFRWEQVLARLDASSPRQLADAIRDRLRNV